MKKTNTWILHDGLLENAEQEAPPAEGEAPPTPETPPVDAVKPEWAEEKFWDAATGKVNAEAIAKSYTDLRAEFNNKNNDKPGEAAGDYLSEEFMAQEGMADMKDDALFNTAFEMAQKHGMGIKQAQGFIGDIMGEIASLNGEAAAPVDMKAELGKLGKNGPQVVTGIKTWVDGLKTEGTLNDEVHAELMKLGSSAAGIKALDTLRTLTGVLNIPTGQAINGTQLMGKADWMAATFATHGKGGENETAYNERMHELGKGIFGES